MYIHTTANKQMVRSSWLEAQVGRKDTWFIVRSVTKRCSIVSTRKANGSSWILSRLHDMPVADHVRGS